VTILALALACSGGEADLAARQEDAAVAAADALAFAMVATELVAHTADPPTGESTERHDGTCGCPCTDRIGTDDSYVAELDYEQPTCVPSTGLLPGEIGGHVWLDYDRGDVGMSRSEAWLPGGDLTLELSGTFTGGPSLWQATLSGPMGVGDDAEATLTDLAIDLSTSLQLDGEVQAATGTARFEGLVLSHQPALDPCPLPLDGTVQVGDAEVSWSAESLTVQLEGEQAVYGPCELSPDWLQ